MMGASVKRLVAAVVLCLVIDAYAWPMVYTKNDHDKLEPYLQAVSSTVYPIPVYRVSSGVNARRSRYDAKKRTGVSKPDGPTQLITVSGLKRMAANEEIKPH